jgi:hypothetical protein
MRRILLGFICLMSLAATAAAALLAVPSDPTAKYFLLEDWDWSRGTYALIKRQGPSGVRLFLRSFDCLDRTVSYGGEGDSMQALRASKSGPFRVRIGEGSIDHDLWVEACARQTVEQKQGAERSAAFERRIDLEKRIWEIRPYRRDGPLRSTNITDDEVRQIQIVANQKLPGSIVNIGGVVSGCACEDGSLCSDQVWIVAHRPDRSRGLLLSKIDDHWIVGPVQQWWLDYEALQARPDGLSTEDEDAMTDRFPKCAAQPAVAGGRSRPAPAPLIGR